MIGHIARAHGIRGDVLVKFYSDDPRRFVAGDQFTAAPSDRSLTIDRIRPAKGGHLVAFVGIENRDEAESLRGSRLTIDEESRRVLPDDEFWPEQLVGLEARNVDGVPVGQVVEVILGDAQDRLVIETGDGSHVQVPFVEALVPHVEVPDGFLVVEAIPGLVD